MSVLKYFILLSASLLILISCKENKPSQPEISVSQQIKTERISHNRKVLNEAVSNFDFYTAIQVTYDLMIDDTVQQDKYLDTLAALYELAGLPEPALTIAERILQKDPNNVDMLNLKAKALMSTGQGKAAMDLQSQLYEKNNDIRILFTKLELELGNGNVKAADSTLKRIEAHVVKFPKDSIDVATDQQGVMQKVPAVAAVHYVKGVMAYGKEQYPQALTHFKRAKNAYPKFVMVNRYLEQWSQQQRSGK